MASLTAGSKLVGRAQNRAFSSSSRSCRLVVKAVTLPAEFKSVKPVGDRVLVKVDKEEPKTSGGIIIPSSAQKKPTSGEVVSSSSVVKDVKIGDSVVYSKYAGTEVEVSDSEHVLLKEDDVIGTMSASKKIGDLKPLQDRILIKAAGAAKESSGGVLLTTDAADKPTIGEVVAVGPGKRKEDSDDVEKVNVAVGAKVLYSKYSGTEFEEADVEYIVVREGDVLAILA